MKPKYEFRGIIENGNVVYGGYFCNGYETDNETEYIVDENRKLHKITPDSRGMKMRILGKEFYHGDIIEIADSLAGDDSCETKKPCNILIASMLWGDNILNLPQPTYGYGGKFTSIKNINVSGILVSDLDCDFRVVIHVDKGRDTVARLYYPPHIFQFRGKIEYGYRNGGYWFDSKENKHYLIEHIDSNIKFTETDDIAMRLDTFGVLQGYGCQPFYDGEIVEVGEIGGERINVKVFWSKGRTEIKFQIAGR